MSYMEETAISCGVHQIEGILRDPKKTLLCAADYLYEDDQNTAFFIFSDTIPTKTPSHGMNLASAIRSLRLGSLVRSRVRKNPNSPNNIAIWNWAVDHKRFKQWYLKNRPKDGIYNDEEE